MIFCQCVGVTDRTITKLIAEGACSVADITRSCGAGRCPPCRKEIAAMLYRHSTPEHTEARERTTNKTERGTP